MRGYRALASQPKIPSFTGVRAMEIKSIVGDGMYTFAIIADANTRRRYRMRRQTGAIQVVSDQRDRTGSGWSKPSFATAEKVRRAIAAATH
jgi:hypothetical protein